MPDFLTFQVVGWADVFTRKVYRYLILENLTYCRKEKDIYLFGYVIMSNHVHFLVQKKEGKLSDWVRDFKKFISKKLLKINSNKPLRKQKINFSAYHLASSPICNLERLKKAVDSKEKGYEKT